MTSRASALAFAVLGIALTIAQDVVPARDWYHAWPYITILAFAVVVMTMYAWQARRGEDGLVGKRLAVAMIGAIAVSLAGLLSGLLGPDTVTVVGTPGTVTPIPDLRVAAFFNAVDAAGLARGDTGVTLRSREAHEAVIGPHPFPYGLSVVFTEQRPAAYVIARDAHGNRLTITQPNNPSFLSPVMLFRQTQEIHGDLIPLDTFAIPGQQRIMHILYFTAAQLASFRHDATPGQPGAIVTASTDAGAPLGLTLVSPDHPVTIGGVTLTIVLGTYPVLQVASAPQPFALIAGLVLFGLAGLWAVAGRRPAGTDPDTAATDLAGAVTG